MTKINIVYLHNGFQFEDEVIRKHNEIGWLGREPLPLEVLCQLQDERNVDKNKYEFNVIHNLNGTVPDDAINIFPIDFQSFPISYESAGEKFIPRRKTLLLLIIGHIKIWTFQYFIMC